MASNEDVFGLFSEAYDLNKQSEMSLKDFLEGCRDDPMRYASAAERMVDAIGEPALVDSSDDTRLGRIFMNRTIKVYPAFSDFYGMEETIERSSASSATPPRGWRNASRSSICWARWAAANRRWPKR